jgi:DNA repair protein RadA/Sms
MTRFSSSYVCQQCGYSQVGWAGKCPECGTWNSLVETVVSTGTSKSTKSSKSKSSAALKTPVNLSEIKKSIGIRTLTKITELDRVLGGGIVPGQGILIAGEPGIGKSTLLTQLSDNLPNVLYICGEESAGQIAIRANRLGVKNKNINLLEETDVDSIISTINTISRVDAVIVDSIQTVSTTDLSGMAGSVGQVRECAFRLLRATKDKNIPLFLVGHVTKEGTVAGPAVLAHIVDTVLWFEGDKTLTIRMLRAVKNRFGPTDEVGVFEMSEKGLVPLKNLDMAFLNKDGAKVSGSIVTSILQGTRPILVEIQALVVPTKLPIPRRVAQGIDSKRLELLLAVLTRRCGIPLYESDVFVNIAGGLKLTEPASDLAVCLAIASSYFDKPVNPKTVAVGEVGLLGEIREVVAQEKRLKEARQLGYTHTISSKEAKYLSQAIKEIK